MSFGFLNMNDNHVTTSNNKYCRQKCQTIFQERSSSHESGDNEHESESKGKFHDNHISLSSPSSKTPDRRLFLTTTTALAAGSVSTSVLLYPSMARAKGFSRSNLPVFGKLEKPSEVTMAAKSLQSESALRSPVNVLSCESCLLNLLPVSNIVFKDLKSQVEELELITSEDAEDRWKTSKSVLSVVEYLDAKRRYLEPKFNEDDSALMQIRKGERGEDLIENLRDRLIQLGDAISKKNETCVNESIKKSLISLADIGELIVEKFPYKVPKNGKYSYLPRLLGRARVTFGMERNGRFLGNITIIADGYTAPITAGNFVDLSSRGFYTGLPMKKMKKRLSPKNDATIFSNLGKEDDPIVELGVLGSFNEGFYDPLTAKLRRLPLEILRIDKSTGVANPTYPNSFARTIPANIPVSILEETVLTQEEGTEEENALVVNFGIPGLVAMNHPDKNINGASSEFFIYTNMDPETNDLLDGKYAPFGYIVEGLDLVQNLQPGDTIVSTVVSEWGILNLKKIKGSSLQDLMNSD